MDVNEKVLSVRIYRGYTKSKDQIHQAIKTKPDLRFPACMLIVKWSRSGPQNPDSSYELRLLTLHSNSSIAKFTHSTLMEMAI